MAKTKFTDMEPGFPYQSSELTKELGVPDSPLVHLAISSLAERLLPTAETALSDTRMQRIQALRAASYAVLMHETFMLTDVRFRASLELPVSQEEIESASGNERTNWLAQASDQLRAEGVDLGSYVRVQASPYGWQTQS
jgi:hypothetical protein